MKAFILLFFIIGTTYGRPNWMRDLSASINQMTSEINANIAQIQQNLRKELAEVDLNVKKTIENVNEELSKNGTKIVEFSTNSGTSRSVISGTTETGERYFHEIEDRIIGDLLYRIERVYNPKTNQIEIIRSTLNLRDPTAKPEILPNDNISSSQNESDKNQQTQPDKQGDSKEVKNIDKKSR